MQLWLMTLEAGAARREKTLVHVGRGLVLTGSCAGELYKETPLQLVNFVYMKAAKTPCMYARSVMGCGCAKESSAGYVLKWVCGRGGLAQLVSYIRLFSFVVLQLVNGKFNQYLLIGVLWYSRWLRKTKVLHVCVSMTVSENEGR